MATGSFDSAALRQVFGAFPSGVVAIAAEIDGNPIGLAASSFTSVSLAPALVSVAISKESKTWAGLRCAPRLGVTILAEHHGRLCRQLAGPPDGRFDDVRRTTLDSGAVTLDEGVACFECGLHREVEAGDHTIVLFALHAVEHRNRERPLVFHRSGFTGLAE